MTLSQGKFTFVPLGKICDISIGGTPARHEPAYWGDGYPWLSIADMNQGKNLVVTKESITQRAVDECRANLVMPGTLLMSFKLSIGKLGFARVPMYTNEAITALPIKDKSEVHPDYLYYALQVTDLLGGTDRAVMGATLNKSKLLELAVPLTSFEEQNRIATVLDRADRLRRLRRYALELSDSYLQSVFLEMFGDPAVNPKEWKVERLEKLLASSPQNGLYVPQEQYAEVDSGAGVKMVHMSDLFYEIVRRGKLKRVNISASETEKYALGPNDVLVARRSLNYEGAAKPCLIPQSDEPLVFESSMIKITPAKDKISPIYLYRYF